jgi:hypothetical protein
VNSGSQSFYVEQMFQIPKNTFFRYLKIIKDHNVLEKCYDVIINDYRIKYLLITDTYTAKSMNGSEGLGRNPTDRGRNGLKIYIICDSVRIALATSIGGTNIHDTKMLNLILRILPLRIFLQAKFLSNVFVIPLMLENNLLLIV